MSVSLKSTKNEYSKPNNLIICDPKGRVISATSYNWWIYIQTDSVGNVIYNEHHYSHTTAKHQREGLGICRLYGTSINFRVDTRSSLGKGDRQIKIALVYHIENLKDIIKDTIKDIRVKGSWKKKNEQRRLLIKEKLFKIKDARRFKNEYLGKKILKPKTKKAPSFKYAWFLNSDYCTNAERLGHIKSAITDYQAAHGKSAIKRLKAWQLRVDKKRDQNKLITWIYSLYIPPSMEKVKQLKTDLKIKGHLKHFIAKIKNYPHLGSCLDMLPEPLTRDHDLFLRYLKSLGITANTFCAFEFEKIHVYLINKLNRKNSNPSEHQPLPVTESILKLERIPALEGKINIIKTVKDLRAEGKRQGHCIGSKMYINQCKRGYQALNFKGHTFFLDPRNQLVEAHGKHNSYTPVTIKNELNELINEGDNVKKIKTQGDNVKKINTKGDNVKKIKTLVLILALIGVSKAHGGLNVDNLLINLGTQNRSKIIELERAKMKIQDTVSIYKKGMSKKQKKQLTEDLKALRKCKFQQPCVEELSGRNVKL